MKFSEEQSGVSKRTSITKLVELLRYLVNGKVAQKRKQLLLKMKLAIELGLGRVNYFSQLKTHASVHYCECFCLK